MKYNNTNTYKTIDIPQQSSGNYLLPLCIRTIGPKIWIVKHLANDILAGAWFALWANGLLTIGSFFLLLLALGTGAGGEQIFIWASGYVFIN